MFSNNSTSIGPRFVQKWKTYFIIVSNILLNTPLLNLSWKTNKCRPKDLRGGAFSICRSMLMSFCCAQIALLLCISRAAPESWSKYTTNYYVRQNRNLLACCWLILFKYLKPNNSVILVNVSSVMLN